MDRRLSVIGVLVLAANLSCASNTAGTGRPPTGAATPAGTAPAVGTVPPPTVPTGAAGAPQSTTSNAPPPPPSVNPAPGQGPPGGGPPGGGFGGGGRPQLTPEQRAARRDSLNTARAAVVQDLMQRIAGYENRRSADEFTNVQLMKDTTAANLLKQMDYYGRSLSVGCNYCHTPGKWDEDTKEEKQTTRVMIQLVDLINNSGLSKMPPGRNGQTPKIGCIACHHGNTRPGNALMP